MRCGTSFYNGTLGKQLTLRFWPLIALNAVIWAIALPITGLTYLRHGNGSLWLSDVDALFRWLSTPMAVCFGVLAAMAVCSHLYATRSCNFTAALPPKRTAVFATHYLTGLLWLLAPVTLMTLLALPMGFGYSLDVFVSGLGLVWMQTLFFYSFAVLCGMLTGHLLALPIFYAVFNGLVGGLWFLLTLLFGEFYYGYPGSLTAIPHWVEWLTPTWKLILSSVWEHQSWVTAVYAGVGVALALFAWLLYVKRPMERAGDVVIWAGLRPVFRYGVAVCSGLALGSLTRLILGLGQLGLAVSVILWAVAGCFVGQMFLAKSVQVLRYWKGSAAVALAFVGLFLGMTFDITGYERRVPASDQVSSVTISGPYTFPNDAASHFQDVQTQDPHIISQVTQLHQTLVEQQPTTGSVSLYYDTSTSLTITYSLSDGTQLSRSYRVPLMEQDVDREGTVTYLVNQLANNPKLMYQAYSLDEMDQRSAEGFRLYYAICYSYFNSESDSLSASQAQEVYQAILRDMEEGNLRRSLFADSSRLCIDLVWSNTRFQGEWAEEVQSSSYTPSEKHSISIYITDSAVHTMEALEQFGF